MLNTSLNKLQLRTTENNMAFFWDELIYNGLQKVGGITSAKNLLKKNTKVCRDYMGGGAEYYSRVVYPIVAFREDWEWGIDVGR